MSGLHFHRIAVSLQVRVSSGLIEQHTVASPRVVGEALAEQITAYVQREQLGYYPALDYFRKLPDVDPDLLGAVDSLSWLVCGLVRDEIRRRLRPVFSTLRFESVQIVANTMPTIRPANANALHELARHYTPDQVRLNLLASSLRRQDNDAATAVALAGHLIRRWLENRFSSLQINDIRYLQT
jgi:hypothetical protein